MGNMVDNVVITVDGVRWVLDLSGWLLHTYVIWICNHCFIPEANIIVYVNCNWKNKLSKKEKIVFSKSLLNSLKACHDNVYFWVFTVCLELTKPLTTSTIIIIPILQEKMEAWQLGFLSQRNTLAKWSRVGGDSGEIERERYLLEGSRDGTRGSEGVATFYFLFLQSFSLLWKLKVQTLKPDWWDQNPGSTPSSMWPWTWPLCVLICNWG